MDCGVGKPQLRRQSTPEPFVWAAVTAVTSTPGSAGADALAAAATGIVGRVRRLDDSMALEAHLAAEALARQQQLTAKRPRL